jgi:hypothetical protein
MLTIILGLIFILSYYHNKDPPLSDIISPLVTLSIARYALYASSILMGMLLVTSLGIELVADFYMNKHDMSLSIQLFSIGHLIRQLAFLTLPGPNILSSIISLFTTLLTVHLMEEFQRNRNISFTTIVCYSVIIVFSTIQISISQGVISFGYVIFIISDLMIAYELIVKDIYPRWIRIVGVPILYWTAQYLLTQECCIYS